MGEIEQVIDELMALIKAYDDPAQTLPTIIAHRRNHRKRSTSRRMKGRHALRTKLAALSLEGGLAEQDVRRLTLLFACRRLARERKVELDQGTEDSIPKRVSPNPAA